ncbi:glycosyltransferase [Agromyces aurantiacus]|uniref:Glycosyltransferase n=1 Tax=Agromyces aurantiacus TaxID=165814 RepID=A0ABV9R1K7_9MICO|nr:glycosyltransferase [Agromyces aurantiacus]MBM7505630.1 UDP:flavonoid glycosyltransferase YjiC (YdhE family) [Agromyces aurantiacus]
MSQHVALVAPPFAGHLHPILGVGVELARRGIPVRVTSTAAARSRIEAAGLPAHALESADDATVAAIAEPAERIGRHPVRLHRQFRATLAVLGAIRDDLDRGWRDDPPAVVVADFTLPVAGPVARQHGARWFTAMPSPAAIGSMDGTPAYCGGLLPPGGPAGRVRDAAARAAVRAFKRSVFALNARPLRALGVTGVFRADGTEQAYSPDTILALGLRELELPRSWPEAVRFVGPVRYSPPGRPGAWGAGAADGDDAEDAQDEDAGGATSAIPRAAARIPRVLVAFGTHLATEKARLVAMLDEVAALVPAVRFDLSLGGSDIANPRAAGASDRVDRVRIVDYVDYDRLDRYDAIVHHGGTGIAQAALAAGRPAVVVPIDYDQPDVAARLVHHDLAEQLDARVLRTGPAGAERLAAAVRRALAPSDDRLAALARFRDACARSDGAVGAADLIERALITPRPDRGRTTGART